MIPPATLPALLDLASGTTLYASLHTATPPDNSNELQGNAYARIPIRGFEAAVVAGEARIRFPTAAADFAAATGAWSNVQTVAFSQGAARGAVNPYLMWVDALAGAPIVVLAGDQVSILARDFHMVFGGVAFTAAGRRQLAEAVNLSAGGSAAVTYYLGLHTGNPPTTANELTGLGYGRLAIAVSFADVGNTGEVAGPPAIASFPAPTGQWAKPTYFGLWDAQAAGTLMGEGAMASDAPTPPSEGAYRVPARGLAVDFTP